MVLALKTRPLPKHAKVRIYGEVPWSDISDMYVPIPGEPGFVGLSAERVAELVRRETRNADNE